MYNDDPGNVTKDSITVRIIRKKYTLNNANGHPWVEFQKCQNLIRKRNTVWINKIITTMKYYCGRL